jgi:hypothetical protein
VITVAWRSPRTTRTLTIRYVRGGNSDFHHAEAVMTAHAVVVTVYLGRATWLTERIDAGDPGPFVIPAVAISDTVRLVLDDPVGDRAIVDGAEGSR